MSSASATPTSLFQPIPESVYRPPPGSPHREQHRQIYRELEALNVATRYGETPYTWGWAILRTVYTAESDNIFLHAADKLNRWLVYYVKLKQPRCSHGAERSEPTDELVKRLYNNVLEDRDQLDSASWDAVYDYFESWVMEQERGNPSRQHIQALGFNPDQYIFRGVPGNVRYNSCIVLDEAALTAISSLPDVPPEIPQDVLEGASGSTVDYQLTAWVWVLCAKTIKQERGGSKDARPFRGWMKVRIHQLYHYWFQRMTYDRDYGMPYEEDDNTKGVYWYD